MDILQQGCLNVTFLNWSCQNYPLTTEGNSCIQFMQDWKWEKKSSDIYEADKISDNGGSSGGKGSAPELSVDEEAPLIPSSRLSHIGRTQLINHASGR